MNPPTVSQGVVAGSIPLFAGHPSPELLPIEGIQSVLDAAWSEKHITRLFNYGDEQGNSQLIDFLAQRLNHQERLGINRQNLMIIGGSTLGVNMVTQHLTQPGDTILVDAPSYRDALHIFRDQRLNICSVPIDNGGIIIAELERALESLAKDESSPKFYYVVPNFQNPSGITMSAARRQTVIALSRRYQFAILEDDVYNDIRFCASLPPSFYALAEGENVLRLGSFSKTLAPGLRIGWLIASAERISQFVTSGALRMGGGANPFTAAIVADYCQSGAWEAHLHWLRRRYQERRDLALTALADSMPAAVKWTNPDGGYFIWLRLPPTLHVDQLEQRAQDHNVYFASGKGFYVDPEAGAHHLRLSFSFVSSADLRAGIDILGQLIGQMTS